MTGAKISRAALIRRRLERVPIESSDPLSRDRCREPPVMAEDKHRGRKPFKTMRKIGRFLSGDSLRRG